MIARDKLIKWNCAFRRECQKFNAVLGKLLPALRIILGHGGGLMALRCERPDTGHCQYESRCSTVIGRITDALLHYIYTDLSRPILVNSAPARYFAGISLILVGLGRFTIQ